MLYKATHSKKPKMSLFTASMDKSAKTGGGAPHPTQYTPSGVGVGVGPDAVTGGFLKAMDMKDKTAIDEKGVESLSEWGVGDQRLAMFFKLCRGLGRQALQEFIRNIVAEAIKRGQDGSTEQELQGYVDLFVLAFQTRDIEEGKGERQLFYWFIIELSKYFPQTVQDILPLIPGKYGSWKDIKLMLEMLQGDIKEVKGAFRKSEREQQLVSLEGDLLLMFQTQLEEDTQNMEKIVRLRHLSDEIGGEITDSALSHPEIQARLASQQEMKLELKELVIGLCAKWAPREGRHFNWLAKRLAIQMFRDKPDFRVDGTTRTESIDKAEKDLESIARGGAHREEREQCTKNLQAARQSAYKRYRQMVARLNKHINTTEILMCDQEGRWKEISPGAVPARCLKIHRRAFNNKTKKGEQRSSSSDRIACANKFDAHLREAIKNPCGKKRVHGAKLMPHELVKVYYDTYGRGQDVDDLTIEAQWVDLRERIKELGSLGNWVSVVDTSGSMSGTPMLVAIALGILVSEVCHPYFKNRFITFSDNPQWHVLPEKGSLREKVRVASSTDWGGSTDFEKTLNMILNVCVQNSVPVEEVREMRLGVFSDMQFNEADGSYGYYGRRERTSFATKYTMIADAWKRAGYFDHSTGEPIVPRITFWNLRGDTMDFPSDANTPGVDMVSGFSANGLKAFMEGDITAAEPDKKATPYDGMRKQLDVERYDAVRLLCQESSDITSKVDGSRYTAPTRNSDGEQVFGMDSSIEEGYVAVDDTGSDKDMPPLEDGAAHDDGAGVGFADSDEEIASLEAQLAAARLRKSSKM